MTKKIQIEFTCDNAEFDGLTAAESIAEVLTPLLVGYKSGRGFPGIIYDSNGNKIGSISFEWKYPDDD